MYTYLITYELHNLATPGSYTPFFTQIKSYTYWANPMLSLWLIKSDKIVSQVRDELYSKMFQQDKLFIVDVTHGAWGSYNLSNVVVEWIKNNL